MHRNQSVELCRFAAAILIACHHSYLFPGRTLFVGGWVFVEFFFMLTGYFTTKHFDNSSDQSGCYAESISYTVGKIKQLVPYAWLGILIGVICAQLQGGLGMRHIMSIPFNLLFLTEASLASGSINFDTPLWFITVFIVVLPPMIVVMRKHGGLYRNILCWLLPLVLYGRIVAEMGKTAVWEDNFLAILRGASDLMLGSFIFYLIESLRTRYGFKPDRKWYRVAGLLLFGIMSWFSIFSPDGMLDSSAGFTMLAFAATGLLLSGDANLVSSETAYRFALHLGKLSMPLFCVHYPVERLLQILIPAVSYKKKLFLAIVLSMAISEMAMHVVHAVSLHHAKSHQIPVGDGR